jgi:hypothetical protein
MIHRFGEALLAAPQRLRGPNTGLVDRNVGRLEPMIHLHYPQ